ncbi:DUF4190 domain-containing protein [Alteribacillus bidgolensis]|uniref:DUF4190 domain-containing protein n=1 Tax=Alteribacillus bidgolensis TaxID=930129 RepID=A0A1G8LTF8_9BACI|nr:DUF4190 domain-containing protein [Alteribacillus bidgolensis]SDI58968.1 protein of unknown function [Alteribacillus bidgolensis]
MTDLERGELAWKRKVCIKPENEPATVNGKAITSLVLNCFSGDDISICYYKSYPGYSAILGLIFGVLGLKEIKPSGQGGRGLAIAGNTCSVIGLIISVIFIIFLVIGIVTFMQMDHSPPM